MLPTPCSFLLVISASPTDHCFQHPIHESGQRPFVFFFALQGHLSHTLKWPPGISGTHQPRPMWFSSVFAHNIFCFTAASLPKHTHDITGGGLSSTRNNNINVETNTATWKQFCFLDRWLFWLTYVLVQYYFPTYLRFLICSVFFLTFHTILFELRALPNFLYRMNQTTWVRTIWEICVRNVACAKNILRQNHLNKRKSEFQLFNSFVIQFHIDAIICLQTEVLQIER